MKTIVLYLLLFVSLDAAMSDAMYDIRILQGRELWRQHNAEQYRIQQANIKKNNAYLKKQEELRKQKRIDANNEARQNNEEYYKSQEIDEFKDDTTDGALIIKKTTIKDKNSAH